MVETRVSWVSVRHEELRVVERRTAIEHALVGEGFQKGDERVDLVGGQRRNAERLDGVPSSALTGDTLPPRL